MNKLTTSAINHMPIPVDLGTECRKAAHTLQSFLPGVPGKGLYTDQYIPASIFEKAKGVAILHVVKAGFLWSGRAGGGLVIAKVPKKAGAMNDDSDDENLSQDVSQLQWSAPSMIVTAGVGVGGQIGAEVTDFVILLMTTSAVKAFSHGGNFTLGGNLSVAAGPIGRSGEVAGTVANLAPIYSYSKSKGLFAGVSIEGSAIVEWKEANKRFYKRPIRSKEILSGQVETPFEARDLVKLLDERVALTAGQATGTHTVTLSRPNKSLAPPSNDPRRSSWDGPVKQEIGLAGGLAKRTQGSGILSKLKRRSSHSAASQRPVNQSLNHSITDVHQNRPYKSNQAENLSFATIPKPIDYHNPRWSTGLQSQPSTDDTDSLQASSYGTPKLSPGLPPKPKLSSQVADQIRAGKGFSPKSPNKSPSISYMQPKVTASPKPAPPPLKPKPFRSTIARYSDSQTTSAPTYSTTSHHSSASPSAPPLPGKPGATDHNPCVIAMYTFEGVKDGDLSFRKGDRIELLKSGNGEMEWWVGRNGNKEGLFPSNYVKKEA